MVMVENFCLLAGRFLLGMYFVLPGLSKISGFEATSTYMAEHKVRSARMKPRTFSRISGLPAAFFVWLRWVSDD